MLSLNCKNVQHVEIYLPCNFEVNPITHFGVIALFIPPLPEGEEGILFFIPPLPKGGGGVYCFTSVRPSFRPSKIFFVAFFSVAVDGRNLIFGHKHHIGIPYCG
jgi:hypothetical protein